MLKSSCDLKQCFQINVTSVAVRLLSRFVYMANSFNSYVADLTDEGMRRKAVNNTTPPSFQIHWEMVFAEMSNCMMEVGVATRWCNPYAQGLNASSLRICLAVDLSHIRACVGSSIVTTTAALREARITSATKMIDYKINLLENTVWDHADECVLIRELSLEGSSWRGWVKWCGS